MSRHSYHNPMSIGWSEGPVRRDRLPTVQEYGLLHERQKAVTRHMFRDAKLHTVGIRGRRSPFPGRFIPMNIKCVNVREGDIAEALIYLNRQYRAMGGDRLASYARVLEQHVDCVPVRIVRQRDRVQYHGV